MTSIKWGSHNLKMNLKTNKLFLLFALMFLAGTISFVSAEVEQNFQYHDQFDLKRPCFNNGTYCSASTSCNMTISYPDGSLLIDNLPMTLGSSFANITVLEGQANKLGFYKATQICCDSGFCGKDTFDSGITGDGNPYQVFPTQFVVIIFGFALIFFGLLRDSVKMLKTIGSLIIFVMGVLTLYPGYSFINYSNLLGMALGFTFIGGGFYFMIHDAFSRDKQTEYYSQEIEREF